MPLLLTGQNTLAFPYGIAPGVDLTHPAAGASLAFSVVGNGISLLKSGIASGSNNANTFPVDSIIGLGTKNASNLSGFTYAGQSTAANTSVTFAFIGRVVNAGGTFAYIGSANSGTGGAFFGVDSGGNFIVQGNGSFVESTFPAYVSTAPYFAAVSLNPSSCVFAVRRLDTGKIFSSSAAGFTMIAPDGTYAYAGCSASGSVGNIGGGTCAAGMISFKFTPLAQLLQWAQDPWSFWYPNYFTGDLDVGKISAITATQAKLLLLGVG